MTSDQAEVRRLIQALLDPQYNTDLGWRILVDEEIARLVGPDNIVEHSPAS